jgi:mRNA interferase RelE/StbE
MYRVDFLRAAAKDLRKLSRDDQDTVRADIQKLGEEPRPQGVVKLTNKYGLYRIRSGDCRVIYSISDGDRLVVIEQISPRGEAYKKHGKTQRRSR